MHLWVNVTFYGYNAVNMIHDVLTTTNPFPYTTKFIFVDVRNNKTKEVCFLKINRIRI